jgi:hypothetical protein
MKQQQQQHNTGLCCIAYACCDSYESEDCRLQCVCVCGGGGSTCQEL